MLQVRFKTLQKNNWGRTPDKNGPDMPLLQLFPENVSKWVPGGGPGEGPRTTFSQPFSVLSPMGSPGEPLVAQMVPKGTKTRPRDCQNEAPGVPKRSPGGHPLLARIWSSGRTCDVPAQHAMFQPPTVSEDLVLQAPTGRVTFLTWALPQGYEVPVEGTVAGRPQAIVYICLCLFPPIMRGFAPSPIR